MSMTTLAPGAPIEFTKKIIPGSLVTALVAMAAAFLGCHDKGLMLLFAVLLGLALHFVSEDKRGAAGIRFASNFVTVGLGFLTDGSLVAAHWQAFAGANS